MQSMSRARCLRQMHMNDEAGERTGSHSLYESYIYNTANDHYRDIDPHHVHTELKYTLRSVITAKTVQTSGFKPPSEVTWD